jgi:hypothetical protein
MKFVVNIYYKIKIFNLGIIAGNQEGAKRAKSKTFLSFGFKKSA